MSDILAKLFGSSNRIKIIRLFLLNPEETLITQEVAVRAQVLPEVARKEITLLASINFISKKRKPFEKQQAMYTGGQADDKPCLPAMPIGRQTGRKKDKHSPRKEGWELNFSFPMLAPLKKLVLNAVPISRAELLKKISKAGKMKLVVLAGIFIQEENSRVDILVVGEGIRRGFFEKALREIEAEVGRNLSYAMFTTTDFFYRLNIYDKFIRDILDYPHEKILNRIGL
ncbi:MAG: hypothetical protein Q7R65_03945 [bacterium]|nr:hypothetical protein [bacterium]